ELRCGDMLGEHLSALHLRGGQPASPVRAMHPPSWLIEDDDSTVEGGDHQVRRPSHAGIEDEEDARDQAQQPIRSRHPCRARRASSLGPTQVHGDAGTSPSPEHVRSQAVDTRSEKTSRRCRGPAPRPHPPPEPCRSPRGEGGAPAGSHVRSTAFNRISEDSSLPDRVIVVTSWKKSLERKSSSVV